MIVHIIWFFVGAVCGILGAGYFFAVIRDRENAARLRVAPLIREMRSILES